jgi:hypothetical protein
MEAKVNDCIYCRRTSIVSMHYKTYVCEDCHKERGSVTND